MKAMILAAGLGTRMKPLTDKVPKPLLSVAGQPLIAHHIERLRSVGFDNIVVNVSHLGDQIETFLAARDWGLTIDVSSEVAPLETAGGIVNALPLLGSEPFLVFNGDVWIDYPLEKIAEKVRQFSSKEPGSHLILVNNPDHNVEGDFKIPLIAESSSKRSSDLLSNQEGEPLTYSGVGVYHPQLFQGIAPGKRALGPLLRQWIDDGKVTGEKFDGYWLDVGTPARLQQLDDFLVKAR